MRMLVRPISSGLPLTGDHEDTRGGRRTIKRHIGVPGEQGFQGAVILIHHTDGTVISWRKRIDGGEVKEFRCSGPVLPVGTDLGAGLYRALSYEVFNGIPTQWALGRSARRFCVQIPRLFERYACDFATAWTFHALSRQIFRTGEPVCTMMVSAGNEDGNGSTPQDLSCRNISIR